jgi:uncharacterized protein (DUF885 family)
MNPNQSQARSEIFALADTFIDRKAGLNPILATMHGVAGHESELPDFSLAGSAKEADLTRSTLATLRSITPTDEIDRIAGAVMIERLESELELHDSYEAHIIFSVLASPVSSIRQVFEMMPTSTVDEFTAITARLQAVPSAHNSWRSALRDLQAMGKSTAQRQAAGVANQLATYGEGAYRSFANRIDPDQIHPELRAAAASADASCVELSNWISDSYLPKANPVDAVGPERYARWARYFTGASLDLEETYQWGHDELGRINDRMWQVANQIKPGARSLMEIVEHLDSDDRYAIYGTDALLAKLRNFTAATVDRMNGTHFDIDQRIKFCDARLAPEGSAAAPYYIPPNEDLSRPGTTWFPTLGHDRFNWWRQASIWYHEAVPGHHLQCATVIIEKDRLSRFQRTEGWTSGYGEGWALYAERLMDELGAFDEPGIEMGYLSAQAMRAVRVIVDIGMHLGFPGPDGVAWNADSATTLMIERGLVEPDFAASEVERYLGLPGQAISYKVGERYWLRARESARDRLGERFSLKDFHAHALRLGPMGLDPFATEMASWRA